MTTTTTLGGYAAIDAVRDLDKITSQLDEIIPGLDQGRPGQPVTLDYDYLIQAVSDLRQIRQTLEEVRELVEVQDIVIECLE